MVVHLRILLFKTVVEAPAWTTRQEKQIKVIQIGKEVKYPYLQIMILYIRDPKKFNQKTFTTNFSEVKGTQSVAFLQPTTNTLRKRSWIHAIYIIKTIKYLGTDLIKKVIDLHNKNFRSLNERETLDHGKAPCLLISRITIVKIAILLKTIYRSNNNNPNQNTHNIFHRNRKKNSKIHIEPENILDCQSNHKQQQKVILSGLPFQTSRYSTEL